MNEAILDYHQWLCDRIAIHEPRRYGYRELFLRLMMAPFTALMTEDERRIEDVLYLRRSYARTMEWDDEQRRTFYRSLPHCSVFEIMVVMVEKMSFQLDGNMLADNHPSVLFFEILDNLELGYLNDGAFAEDPDGCLEELERVVKVLVERQYDAYGNGSFFPVEAPPTDMSKCNIVEQMDVYLIEKYRILD